MTQEAPIAPKAYKEDPGIRAMRIGTWFLAVARKGPISAAQLEERFAKPGCGNTRSCIWDKYRRGEVDPSGGSGAESLANRVEQVYPGTALWLSLPIWRLADRAPMEMSQVRRIYEGIRNPEIRLAFIAAPRLATGKFWRRPFDIEEVVDYLLQIEDIESLVALLALVREAEIAQEQLNHLCATQGAERFINKFCLTGDLMPPAGASRLLEYLNASWRGAGYFLAESY